MSAFFEAPPTFTHVVASSIELTQEERALSESLATMDAKRLARALRKMRKTEPARAEQILKESFARRPQTPDVCDSVQDARLLAAYHEHKIRTHKNAADTGEYYHLGRWSIRAAQLTPGSTQTKVVAAALSLVARTSWAHKGDPDVAMNGGRNQASFWEGAIDQTPLGTFSKACFSFAYEAVQRKVAGDRSSWLMEKWRELAEKHRPAGIKSIAPFLNAFEELRG